MKDVLFITTILSLLQLPLTKQKTYYEHFVEYISIPSMYVRFCEAAVIGILLSRTYFWWISKIATKIPGVPVLPNDEASTYLGWLFGYTPGFKLPLIPNINKNNHLKMMEMFIAHGPVVQCRTLGKQMLLVADPILAYDVLQNCNIRSSDTDNDYESTRLLLTGGSSSVFTEGGQLIANQVDKLLDELTMAVGGDAIELDTLFGQMTLNIMLSLAFGVDSLEDFGYVSVEDQKQVINDLETVFNMKLTAVTYSTVFRLAWKFFCFMPEFCLTLFSPILFFFPKFTSIMQSSRHLHDLEHRIWRHVLVQNAKDEGVPPGSLRSQLIEFASTHKESEVLAQICCILMKGHEKTAHSLSNFFYALGVHDHGKCVEVVRSAAASLHNKMFDEKNTDTDSIAAEVASYVHTGTVLTPIVEACIKESMRLYPISANGTIREIQQEGGYEARTSIPGENGHITIPNKTTVLVHTFTLHNGTSWSDPATFQPQRWLCSSVMDSTSMDEKLEIDEDAASQFVSGSAYGGCGKRVDELTFLPFGFGPRNCAGMQLALQQMRITITSILLAGFSFEFSKEDIYAPQQSMQCNGLLKPKRGMPVKVTRLEDVY